ncbi:hypothetical protein UMM65_02245 [Aureibaculum sp. 2210JD6-5]|uniref:hypothetical protein n=1 Tax=Aureibaculum sp. 2210JD6-5 TaxID=3103957 RepID=UPI002AACE4E1|nr:hypothetical protein [Aureibaculum sp. 2210JD6-5]MDY7394046.1 hypothetical protein [Aureibaculum sp. 2210JD6-5]
MKLSEKQKQQIKTCIEDLEHYYATCGNEADYDNLEVLKVHLNTVALGLNDIEVVSIAVKKEL